MDLQPARRAFPSDVVARPEPRRSGIPIPSGLRAPLERAFGHDFSQVRIHAGPEARQATTALRSKAFTVGPDIVLDQSVADLGQGRAQKVLAHELAHVVQHRRFGPSAAPGRVSRRSDPAEREARLAAREAIAFRPQGSAGWRPLGPALVTPSASIARQDRDAGVEDAGPTPPATAPAPSASASEVADLVKAWMDYKVPGAAAGIGDPDHAYGILRNLDSDRLLAVLTELDRKAYLEVLAGYSGAGRADPRLEPFLLAVKYHQHDLPDAERARGPSVIASLDPADQSAVRRYLASLGRHRQEIFLGGAEAESTRLANLTLDALEAQRKAAEAKETADAEAAAKAAGKAPPAKPSTVSLEKVVDAGVEGRKLKPIPPKAWTDLGDPVKADWTNRRAPAAIAAVMASIKGTELETTMAGHSIVFKPLEVMKAGGYAAQGGNDLMAGMTFIQDAERDPKNVWPILAHEIGGHFEYGTTYADAIANKVLAKLPETQRKRYTETEDGRKDFFNAYKYSETEIFSALRQRQYDVPVTGPAPVHGALRPDANIAGRLNILAASYPPEVVTAILYELNRKVQASSKILDRDKAYFLAEVKKRGYAL